MKDVIIHLRGTQTIDGEHAVTELTTLGRMTRKNGRWCLYYDTEQSARVTHGSHTTMLAVRGEQEVLIEQDKENHLIVEKGQRLLNYNESNQMLVGIFGQAIRSNLTSGGGELYVSYTVDVGSDYYSSNELEIKVMEA